MITTLHCHVCDDAHRATTLLQRQLQHAPVSAVLRLHYYYDNYNALPCRLCYYCTTTTKTTTRCRARRATTTLLLRKPQHYAVPVDTLLLRQLQHALVSAVQLLHYYYNTFYACSDNTTLLLLKLQCTAMPAVMQVVLLQCTTTTRCRAHCVTTTLLLRQLQCTAMPAMMPTVLLLHFYYENYNTLPCPLCYYYFTTTTTTTRCRT